MANETIIIRICEITDLGKLEETIPSPGISTFHKYRFERQTEGKSLYLIAWSGSKPVGHLYIIWDGHCWLNNKAAAQYANGCPELNALSVIPEFQNQGIGTCLIATAEEIIKAKGLKSAGICVGIKNLRAKRLYERLGYVDWGQGSLEDSYTLQIDENTQITESEQVTMLIKEFT